MKCQQLLYKSKILLLNGLIQILQNPGINVSRNLLKASSVQNAIKCTLH